MSAGIVVPAELVLDPLIDLRSETDGVETVFKGPVTKAPLKYKADSATDTNILFQNVTPSSTETVLSRDFMIKYSFYVAYTFVADVCTVLAGADAENPENYFLQIGGNLNPGQGNPVVLPIVRPPAWSQYCAPLPASFDVADGVTIPIYLDPRRDMRYGTVGAFCPRSLPLNSVTRNVDLKINGAAIPFSSMELAPLWTATQEDIGITGWNSTFPFGRDTGVVELSQAQVSGLGKYDQKAVQGWKTTRAQQKCTVVGFQQDSGAAAVANARAYRVILRYDINEPLVVPPLRYGDAFDYAGISRVANVTIAMTLQNITRMLSMNSVVSFVATNTAVPAFDTAAHIAAFLPQFYGLPIVTFGGSDLTLPAGATVGAEGGTFTFNNNLTAKALAAPELSIMYAVPDQITLRQQPQFVIYPYELYQMYTTPVAIKSLNPIPEANAAWECMSPAIRMATLPSRIYIFAQPSIASKGLFELRARTDKPNGMNITDHFLSIEKVNVQFLERVGQFTTYSASDLFRMSSANGYRGSEWDWRYRTGSLVILDTNSDICLSPREADGQNVVATFQVTVNGSFDVQHFARMYAKTTDIANIDYTLYIVASIPGKVIIGGGQMQVVTEGPNQAQVFSLLSRGGSNLQPKDIKHNSSASAANAAGGGLLSAMGRVGRWARKQAVGLAKNLITPENMATLANAVRQKILPDEPAAPAAQGGDVSAGSLKRMRY